MIKLVLLRHGQSTWNKENIFTGWVDVPLSPEGELEAKEAGKLLAKEGFTFDFAFTSFLKRAKKTLALVLDEMKLSAIDVDENWRLNERHYGALQGKNKKETVEKFGEEQVFQWRRGFVTPPPALTKEDPRFPGNDPLYEDLAEDDLPLSESLKDTIARVLPYWNSTIVRALRNKRKVLVVAHGNSLRAIVKHLDNISDEDITHYNIPTGIPLVFELDDELRPLKQYYLGDQEKVKQAQESVKHQT